MVEKKHILFLVEAAISIGGRHGSSFSWLAGEERKTLRDGDYEKAAEAANMLWQENAKSISARYSEDDPAGLGLILPSDFSHEEERWEHFNPVQVFKSCDCLEYQSCEHEGWDKSEACAFLNSLRQDAWQSLPGYDGAEWGAPETLQAQGRQVICLSKMLAGRA